MNPAKWTGRRIGPAPFLDLVLAFAILLPAFVLIYRAADWKGNQYRRTARDLWFDADTYRVFDIETDLMGENDRTTMHPLYPYLAYPVIWSTSKATGRDREWSARLFHSFTGALWLALFYLLLRRVGCRRLDAFLFTAVGATSASGFFWLPSIETFTIGSLSIFPTIALVAGAAPGSPAAYFGAGLLSLGVTVTNWMATAFASLIDLSRRRFALVSLATIAAVIGFGKAHELFFPRSWAMFAHPLADLAWVFTPESGGPLAILRAFFFNSVVAPQVGFLNNYRHAAWPLMSFQQGALFSGSRWAWVATPAWAALLAMGGAALYKLKDRARLRTFLVLTVLYQLLLHLVYGRETFLYSLHFVPLLILCAALASQTRLRPWVLACALALVLTNAPNNAKQFRWAKQYSQRFPVFKSYGIEINARINRPLLFDPTWQFRFWHDLNFKDK